MSTWIAVGSVIRNSWHCSEWKSSKGCKSNHRNIIALSHSKRHTATLAVSVDPAIQAVQPIGPGGEAKKPVTVAQPVSNQFTDRSILAHNARRNFFLHVTSRVITWVRPGIWKCVWRNYRTIILPVVLYGCETWSLTLMEEHRSWVFENRMLRRIFVPRRDEVTGDWSKLHNEELLNCTPRQT
jgi:hypothetical protein